MKLSYKVAVILNETMFRYGACLIAALLSVAGQTALAADCPVVPNGKNYAGQNLTNHNFHADAPGSLVNANFENAILNGANFDGQNLSGASFKGAILDPSSFGSTQFNNTTLTQTCFIGASMNATDFTYAKIECADFSGTSLLDADFGPLQNITENTGCRTNFSEATIDVNAIRTRHWGAIDFSNTRFQNVTPGNFSLAGADISNAILVGANFDGIDISNANLSRVNLSNGSLINADLNNSALNNIDLTLADLSYANMQCTRFYGAKNDGDNNPNAKKCPSTVESSVTTKPATLIQTTFNATNLTNSTLNYARLSGAVFSGATLNHASFSYANLEPSGLISATSFLGSDLSNAFFSWAKVNSVQFSNLFMPNATFSNTIQKNTDFSGSIMPNADFDNTILQSVSFTGAVLQKAKFTNSKMKTSPDGSGTGVNFNCTQLGGASFADSTVSSASFNAAVMPTAASCCPEKADFVWCGSISATQQSYGPTILPILNTTMACPSGKTKQCSGSDWVVPNWSTSLCNAEHVTKSVWSKPPCDVPPSDIVFFKDENLKRCISESLPDTPSEISVQTALKIHEVACPGLGISDTTGLEQFKNLFKLDLSANKLTQFKLRLKKLQSLSLSNNQLTLLDVSKNPSLVKLSAANNELSAVLHLDIIPSVEVLDLSSNQLTQLDLAVLDSVIFVDVSDNLLTTILDDDITSLDRLTSMTYLDLSNNSLNTIGSLKALASNEDTNPHGALNSLQLECNPTFQCHSLELNGGYGALRTSQCAEFNSAAGDWVVRAKPSCPSD